MLDGAPLNVFADGLGAIQVRQDGVAAGLFYDPSENPAHAGLEIKEGETYYPLQDGFATAPGRVTVEALDDRRRRRRHADAAARSTRSARTCGSARTITYTDGSRRRSTSTTGSRTSRARRRRSAPACSPTSSSATTTAATASSRTSRRASSAGATRPAGSSTASRRSRPGRRSRRATSSSSSTTSRPPGSTTRSTRRRPTTASASIGSSTTSRPGETRGIDVRWLLAAPAPPGTVSPPARRPSRTRRRHPRPAAACCRRRSPASPSTSASARAGSSTRRPSAKKFVELKDPAADPGRQRSSTPRKGRVNLISAADSKGGIAERLVLRRHLQGRPDPGPSRSPSSRWPSRSSSCPKGKKASRRRPRRRRRASCGATARASSAPRGKFSSATVRGTQWVVIDRCDGTLTRVTEGTVARARLREAQERASSGPASSTSRASQVSWVSVLAGFLVAHMVGDYLLQTDWQARNKRGGLGGDRVARRALLTPRDHLHARVRAGVHLDRRPSSTRRGRSSPPC